VLLARANLPDGHGELYVLLALAGIVVFACVFVLVRRGHDTAVRAEEERRRREAGGQPTSEPGRAVTQVGPELPD